MNWFNGQKPESQPAPSLNASTPPSPEGAPVPKGFRVKVESPELILQAIQKGVSGEVGHMLMESPFKEVRAKLLSQQGSFNILASIEPDMRWAKGPELNPRVLIQRLSQTMDFVAERGGNAIIKGSQGTQLAISLNKFNDKIIISTGIVEGSSQDTQLIPAPESTKENFDRVMSDVVETFSKSMAELYKIAQKTCPDEEFVIHPPSQQVGGLFEQVKTPENLLGKLEIEKPDISFEDIGGNQKAKKEIESLAFALKNPELYRKWGTRPPKGILLYGPPGTGKTLMAKALAAQAEARFFHVESSDIASKWYGESEKITKQIFELANSGEKTIIFFDEVDAIAPRREGAHEATQKVVSTLLENMDGLASNDNVMVVASTNRLDGIEPALLRAGRFDRWVEVPVPDEEGRKQILGIHIAKAEKIAGRKLFGEINLDAIIAKTEKLSGADLAEIVRRVLEEKVRLEGTTGQEPGSASSDDFLKQLEGYERTLKAKKTIGFITSA